MQLSPVIFVFIFKRTGILHLVLYSRPACYTDPTPTQLSILSSRNTTIISSSRLQSHLHSQPLNFEFYQLFNPSLQ
jgi:hypothetical protein